MNSPKCVRRSLIPSFVRRGVCASKKMLRSLISGADARVKPASPTGRSHQGVVAHVTMPCERPLFMLRAIALALRARPLLTSRPPLLTRRGLRVPRSLVTALLIVAVALSGEAQEPLRITTNFGDQTTVSPMARLELHL